MKQTIKYIQRYAKPLIAGLLLFALMPACSPEKSDYPDSPVGNFNALWQIINDRYCFLDYKQVDWTGVYDTYRPCVKTRMTDEELFGVMAKMLGELRDGHVNLSAPFDISRYWDWMDKYPINLNIGLIEQNYLYPDYKTAGGIKYKVLPNNIGYIYYSSFTQATSENDLDAILRKFSGCKGTIIDVRGNSGGTITVANSVACRFTNERVLTGYIQHKTGKGHRDFSDPYPIYLEPSSRIRYQKPVTVLTNRGCYSATNNFVSTMKELPNVTIVGDTTGGGSGLPFSSEIPNGWTIRFSSSPILSKWMEQIEFGIAPHYNQKLLFTDEEKGIDSIIERACAIIEEKDRQIST